MSLKFVERKYLLAWVSAVKFISRLKISALKLYLHCFFSHCEFSRIQASGIYFRQKLSLVQYKQKNECVDWEMG